MIRVPRPTARRSIGGRCKQLMHSGDGSSVVEMSITIPALFTLLFCIIELCLIFYSREMISESAREGTRYAMFRGASCKTSANASCTTTAALVNSYVSGLGWPNVAGGTVGVSTTYPTLGSQAVGAQVQVVVTYAFHVTLPLVPRNSFTMSSKSIATIVQ